MGERSLLLPLLVLLYLSSAWTQIPRVDETCCGQNLMDAGGHVVVEPFNIMEATLTSPIRTYVAAKVVICSPDPFYLQLWEPAGTTGPSKLPEFKLTWQHYYDGGGYDSILVFDDDNWVTPSANSRFGMYSPLDTSLTLKYGIPYTPHPPTHSPSSQRVLYRTQKPIGAPGMPKVLNVTIKIELDNLPWPRIFSTSNVRFCTDKECENVGGDVPSGQPGPRGPPGPPGPAGEPGQCEASDCLPGQDLPDVLGGLPEAVDNVKTDTDNLIGDVDEVKDLIKNLLESKSVTGTCPAGFTPGTIGVGGCYQVVTERVPLAVAHMLCRTYFPGSILAHIPNQVTENFLKAEVINRLGGAATADTVYDFWTRGIWSERDKMWVWYDESTRTKSRMSSYSNWGSGQVTNTGPNRCVAVSVFFRDVSSVWNSNECHSHRNFICEYPKTCL